MKILPMLTIFLTLVACGSYTDSMTNDEIIREISKCEKAGMKPRLTQNRFTHEVKHVICIPKGE